MSSGLAVAKIDGSAKRTQRVFVAALDLLKRGSQLCSSLGDDLFEMQTVVFHLLFELSPMQGVFETGHHSALPERLNEVVVRAVAHRLHAYINVIHASGDQERHVPKVAANFCEQLHAGETRHLQIRDYCVEPLALERFEGFLSATSGSAVKRGRSQDQGKKLARRRFVVDRENSRWARRSLHWFCGAILRWPAERFGFVHCGALSGQLLQNPGP